MATAEERPIKAEDLPRPIVYVLEGAIRRRRNVILLRGLLAVVAVAIGSLLVIMAIDQLVTIVSSTTRWLLCAAALAILFGSIGWWLVRPLARRMTLVRMAQLVDAHHPEFEERVSSTVELLSARKDRYSDASPILIEALTSQAVQQVRAVEPRQEFNFRSARPFLIAAGCAAAIGLGLLIVWPDQTKRLFARAINPYDSSGLHAGDVKVEPGHRTVANGDSLRVTASLLRGRADKSTLLVRDATGTESRIPMSSMSVATTDGGTFFATIPQIVSPVSYRVQIGGAISSYYEVRVTPRLAVNRLQIHYEIPAYTKRAARTVDQATGDILAPVGTIVTLTATCNKPLRKADLRLGGKTVAATELIAGSPNAAWRFTLEPKLAGVWSMTLTDEDNLNLTTDERTIKVVADAAPIIGIVEPKEAEVRMRPDDRMPIVYRVREDYGISAVKLLIRHGSGQEIAVKTSLPQPSTIERGTWAGRAMLDLRSIALPNVPKIEVFVDVRDTLPKELGGPQRALSKPITVVLDGNAPSYSAQSAEKSLRKFYTALGEALNLLKGAKGQLAAVRPNLEKQPLRLTPEGARAMETSLANTSKAEDILWKLSEENDEPELTDVAEQTGDVARHHVAPARQALELIPLAHVKKEQVDQAKTAEEQIDAAIAGIEAILKRLGAEQERLARARELAAEVGSLADDQARLRETTENAEDPNKPNSAEDIAERIRDAQWQIAFDATALARKIDQAGYNAGPEHREASDLARQTANRLIDKKTDEAIPLGQQAADKFAKAKEKLTASPPPQPPQDPLDPPFAESAKRLEERQRRVNEQLDALKKGDLAKALKSLQQDVADRAKQLAQRAEKAQNTPQPQAPQAGNPQGPKDVKMPYKDTIGQAQEKAEMAAANLEHINNVPKISPPKFVEGPQSPSDSGGNPDGGQGTKGGGSNTGAGSSKGPSPSNNNINNTIAKGKNLGKATLTAEALMNQKPGQNQGPSGGSGTTLQKDAEELLRKGLAQILADNNPLAKGFGGFGAGAPDVPVPPTPPSEFSAVGAEPQPGGEPQSSAQGGEPGDNTKPGKGDAKLSAGQGRVVARLSELGISGNDWLRLPADLRAEMLRESEHKPPREYRELVRRYFQTMARRSGENK